MSNKILELGRHSISVDSIIERLDRHRGKIKHITAIVTYEDEIDVQYDTDDLSVLSHDAMLLAAIVQDLIL